MMTTEDRRWLVTLARQAVAGKVEGRGFALGEIREVPPGFGVFVTVKVGGELRGCLGTLGVEGHLGVEVARCAADAAGEDPRFQPIEPGELAEVSIEISVLGSLERIDPTDPDTIHVGVHGLVVERGRRRGLLLPQVAIQWSWTREQFLTQTCLKAGLPPDAWQGSATVYRFTAEVFGD